MIWVSDGFQGKWHAAETQNTKALCGHKAGGASFWVDGNRQWDATRWDRTRDDDPSWSACAKCRRALDRRALIEGTGT